MGDRKYAANILKVWKREIDKAEEMVAIATKDANAFGDGSYVIQLDPEDFLDLCAGVWHKN